MKLTKYTLPLGEKKYKMGILNYTPDSFSDGGRFFTPEKALERALQLKNEGANIIDLGCVSTRPGSKIISQEEEMTRLSEALPPLVKELDTPLSIDSFRPECARYALENGAAMINDVSGKINEEMLSLCKEYGAALVLTHNPGGASDRVEYEHGVTQAVRLFFLECIEKVLSKGVSMEQLCLDPGFGFGKTTEQNMELIENLPFLKFKGIALLAGVSRKRFIGEIYGIENPCDRDEKTKEIEDRLLLSGADIIRTHKISA